MEMRMNVERNQKMRRTRFTLIELLVVVAILAILAGLLIPALNKARVRTLTVSCLSNVKQQGVCAAMYSQDFEDYIPAAHKNLDGVTPWAQSWIPLLWSYAYPNDPSNAERVVLKLQSGKNIFTCPAFQTEDAALYSRYSFNWNVNMKKGTYSAPSIGNQERHKTSFTKYPSRTFLSIDDSGELQYATRGRIVKLLSLPAARRARCADVVDGVGSALRHGGEVLNVLFLDGHAATSPAAKLYLGGYSGIFWTGIFSSAVDS